jgi:DNA-binding PadR family transcriptional regulator
MRSIMSARVSLLGYALLGLLHQRPSSGYALRRVFATTPMGTFSDSPGAIYPALRRLERQGLVRGRVEPSAGLRLKQTFRLTTRGLAALKEWLGRPLTRGDVVRGMDDVMLRLAFMDEVMAPAASIRLLQSLARELAAYLPTLHAYLSEHRREMPLSGRLALESGIRAYEDQSRWVRDALKAYGAARARKGKGRGVSS